VSAAGPIWGTAPVDTYAQNAMGAHRCRRGRVENVLRLHGVSLTPQDAANLVDTLHAEGSPVSVTTAELIQRAVRLQFASVTLTPTQSEAIVAVLKDPLGRSLVALRDRLAIDHRELNHPTYAPCLRRSAPAPASRLGGRVPAAKGAPASRYRPDSSVRPRTLDAGV
jgi:hypothetical protein